jgi:hypothetical protein
MKEENMSATEKDGKKLKGLKKLFLIYLGVLGVEFVLLFVFGYLLSNEILIFGNYSYYGYAVLVFLPFIAYIIKYRENLYSFYNEKWQNFALRILLFAIIWLLQLFPFFVFEYVLPYFHLNYYISATVLTVLLALYLFYAIVLYFIYNFFRRILVGNKKLLLIAILGLALAVLFIKNNNLSSEFGFLIQFEGIFVALVPVLFNFIYNIFKGDRVIAKEIINQFALTETFGVLSITLLLLAYLLNNEIPSRTVFDLNKLSLLQFTFLGSLTLSLSLLFSLLISIIFIMWKINKLKG